MAITPSQKIKNVGEESESIEKPTGINQVSANSSTSWISPTVYVQGSFFSNNLIQQQYSNLFTTRAAVIESTAREVHSAVRQYNLTNVWGDPVKLGQSATLSNNGNYVAYMERQQIGGSTAADRLIVRDIKTGIQSSYTFGQQGQNYNDPSSLRLYGNYDLKAISPDGGHALITTWNGDFSEQGVRYSQGVYWVDLNSHILTRIDVDARGVSLPNDGYWNIDNLALSGDGKSVILAVREHDPNFATQSDWWQHQVVNIYSKNIDTGELTKVDLTASGEAVAGFSSSVSVSNDGRFVCFVSDKRLASNDPDPINAPNWSSNDVYVKDLVTGSVTIVSVDAQGNKLSNDYGYSPRISGDGHFVIFQTTDSAPNDINGTADIYIKSLVTGDLNLVSSQENARPTSGFYGSIDNSGNYVVYQTDWQRDVNGHSTIQYKNIATGELETLPREVLGLGTFPNDSMPTISGSGDAVTFWTWNKYNATDNTTSGDYYLINKETQINGDAGNDDLEWSGTNSVIINAGAGDDIIKGGGGLDTLIGGLGRDTFVFDQTSLAVVDVIKDFEVSSPLNGSGDKLDFSDLIGSYLSNSANVLDLVHTREVTAGTLLSVLQPDQGSGNAFRDITLLENVRNVSVAQLFQQGNIVHTQNLELEVIEHDEGFGNNGIAQYDLWGLHGSDRASTNLFLANGDLVVGGSTTTYGFLGGPKETVISYDSSGNLTNLVVPYQSGLAGQGEIEKIIQTDSGLVIIGQQNNYNGYNNYYQYITVNGSRFDIGFYDSAVVDAGKLSDGEISIITNHGLLKVSSDLNISSFIPISAGSSHYQNDPNQLFQRIYGGEVKASGDFFVAGMGGELNPQVAGSGITYWTYGNSMAVSVAKYTSSGSLDSSFSNNGMFNYSFGEGTRSWAMDAATDGNGNLYVLGGVNFGSSGNDIFVMKLHSNGTIDTDYGNSGAVVIDRPTGDDEADSFLVDNTGSVLIGGSTQVGDHRELLLAVLTSSGSLDPLFGNNGIYTEQIGTNFWDANLAAVSRIVNGAEVVRLAVSGTSWNAISQGDFVTAVYNIQGTSLNFAGPSSVT